MEELFTSIEADNIDIPERFLPQLVAGKTVPFGPGLVTRTLPTLTITGSLSGLPAVSVPPVAFFPFPLWSYHLITNPIFPILTPASKAAVSKFPFASKPTSN